MKPLALTIGDPSGIGPEIAMLAFMRRQKASVPPFLLLADPDQLKRRAQLSTGHCHGALLAALGAG